MTITDKELVVAGGGIIAMGVFAGWGPLAASGVAIVFAVAFVRVMRWLD